MNRSVSTDATVPTIDDLRLVTFRRCKTSKKTFILIICTIFVAVCTRVGNYKTIKQYTMACAMH